MKPEKTIRAGAIEASIWLNEAENGQFKTISLSRSYKDKEGNWKNSGILRQNDIPKAMLVLNKAYEYLALAEESAQSAN